MSGPIPLTDAELVVLANKLVNVLTEAKVRTEDGITALQLATLGGMLLTNNPFAEDAEAKMLFLDRNLRLCLEGLQDGLVNKENGAGREGASG
jgi:hypothetical protein